MNLSDLSDHGEFGLIDKWEEILPKFLPIHTGIGDDGAVRQLDDGSLEVITVDTLVENDHFNGTWSTAEQIGQKAIEVNISDIAAMGATPTYALISLVLSPTTTTQWTERLYAGIAKSCNKHQLTIIGGDTTHGAVAMISITCFGKISAKNLENLSLRSDAKSGDYVCVTGEVGGSMAGYLAYKNEILPEKNTEKYSYIKKRHLEPKARLGLSKKISPYINAMIDVSDGVASEAKHIATQSKLGVKIFAEKLPIHEEVFTLEESLNKKKYHCALSGGEDFELLFTISPKKLEKLEKKYGKNSLNFQIIGEMTPDIDQRDLILPDGEIEILPNGFDHFDN